MSAKTNDEKKLADLSRRLLATPPKPRKPKDSPKPARGKDKKGKPK